MARISIRSLQVDKRSAGRVTRILHSIDLEIRDGEFLVLVGPSGCGKTTLLRCIAGLETPTRGEIAIDGQVVNGVEPRDRDIAMVFQSYALYPHMTVADNLAFGLRLRKTPRAAIEAAVAEAASMLEITPLLHRYPKELSGGQRQRVAMGRAVVRRPKAFLFDEPLSNLDAALRQQMRVELLRLHQRLRATMIYVTHDQVEAMTLADRIVLMNQGRLVQIGSPEDLYERPDTLFVARFLGTPEINVIPGQLTNARFVSASCPLTPETNGFPDGEATLAVRAEDLQITEVQAGQVQAQVEVIEQLGWENLLHLRVGETILIARCEARSSPKVGEAVGVRLHPGRFHLFLPEGAGGSRLVHP